MGHSNLKSDDKLEAGQLDGPKAPTSRSHATKDGHPRVVEIEPTETTRFQAEGQGAGSEETLVPVRLKVLTADGPASGASIEMADVNREYPDGVIFQGPTDSAGNVGILVEPGGAYLLQVGFPGHGVWTETVEVGDSGSAREVLLTPGWNVTLRVVDELQRCDNAWKGDEHVVIQFLSSQDVRLSSTARMGETVTFSLPPGSYSVRLVRVGDEIGNSASYGMDVQSDIQSLCLVLPSDPRLNDSCPAPTMLEAATCESLPGSDCSVHGRVVDEVGQPVAAAQVRARALVDIDHPSCSGRGDLQDMLALVDRVASASVTNAEGSFMLGPLPCMPSLIWVERLGADVLCGSKLTEFEAGTDEEVVLVAEPAALHR